MTDKTDLYNGIPYQDRPLFEQMRGHCPTLDKIDCIGLIEMVNEHYNREQDLRKNFVEQAFEIAIKCNYNSSEQRMPDTRTAYNVGIDDFMQAIRDKFK